jgi:hypothetical protein
MRFVAVALVLAWSAPTVASAQAMNPVQATGMALNIARLVYGAMYPAPRCGPHDAPPPRPYQPTPPSYVPPPHPDETSSFDSDDDDDDQPLPPRPSHHLSTANVQPSNHPDADDESDQTAGVRARDSGQPDYDPARTIDQGQSSGQVAEIPSLNGSTGTSSQSGNFGPQQ